MPCSAGKLFALRITLAPSPVCYTGWHWYLTIFFGLYALIEATGHRHPVAFLSGRVPLAVYTLTFSMLSLYCFLAWFPSHVFLHILPGFRWLYLSGLWAWGWPLLALALPFKRAGV